MLAHSFGSRYERVYAAPDIASALAFATRAQQDGQYQFFRGQENADWLPDPSLVRVPAAQRDEVRDRLSRFIGYAGNVARAAGIEYSHDSLWAIAQHYGLPTNFLDLTTDPIVAAMFACPPDTAWSAKHATIFLYTDEMLDLWRVATEQPGIPQIELLRIDVSNLWRLQAQRGLFLFNPISNFCEHFMPDRVVFPHPAGGFVQPGYELYPKNKSLLELQLDLYFNLETTEKNKKDLREIFTSDVVSPEFSDNLAEGTTPRLAALGTHFHVPWLEDERQLHQTLRSNALGMTNAPLRALPDTYFEPMWKFRQPELGPHPSWFDKNALAWLTTSVEPFQFRAADPSDDVVVDLNQFHDILPCGPGATIKFDTYLEKRPRDRDIRFTLRYTWPTPAETAEHEQSRTDFLRRVALFADYLWTGLRRTPAATDIIARCIHNLCASAVLTQRDDGRWDECYGERYVDHLKVEHFPMGGHSRTAKVLCADLAPAVRSDLTELVEVVPIPFGNGEPQPEISVHLQQMIFPQYLFDFNRFSEVFITRVLPYEAIVGAMIRQTPNGIAFNPRMVKVFGLS